MCCSRGDTERQVFRWILLPLAASDLIKPWSWKGRKNAFAAKIATGMAMMYVEMTVRYLERLPVVATQL